MLPDLKHLAVAYQRERDRRLTSPRAAEARIGLDRAARHLRTAADAIAELGRHEALAAGVTLAEVTEMYEKMEAFAARFGAGVASIAELGANGRRRLPDYTEPNVKFILIHQIAERLDELGVPLGGQEAGALRDHAREALHLADEVEPSRGLGKVVQAVLDARKNRPCVEGVHALTIAAE